MREDIIFAPAGDIKQRAGGQEAEAGLREVHAAFADQHGVERQAEFVQIEHIVAGIFDLLGADGLCAPVGRLLLLVEFDMQEFGA